MKERKLYSVSIKRYILNIQDKSMAKFNIERNVLDYLLTDVQPYELPEIFTYYYFYDFLNNRGKIVDNIFDKIYDKYKKNKSLFDSKWNSQPLVFKITKNDDSFRKMSLMQPLSVLQVSMFVKIYQKDILYKLDNPVFSIRYHSKNNNLYYTNKSKKLIDYKYDSSKKSIRRTIERSNSYFRLKNHSSITSFLNSNLWELANIKFKYFVKADYKSCFDSVYTHTFKWIIAKDSIDSLNLKNNTSNLHVTTDRILQNINGSISNGVIVGPEFSRMMVEVLLQKIDKSVFDSLLRKSLKFGTDYVCYRYVDDLFIFCHSNETSKKIIEVFDNEASKFLLMLNKQKTENKTTPFIQSDWLKETKEVKEMIVRLFKKNEVDSEKVYLIDFTLWQLKDIKENFTRLMSLHPRFHRTITSYLLSVILNRFGENTAMLKYFKPDSSLKFIRSLIDLLFYIYQFSTSFENTQKFISILYYLNLDIDFKNNRTTIDYIVQKYDNIFVDNQVNDNINLLLSLSKYDLNISYSAECKILNDIIEDKNPLIMASYLLYSKYNDKHFKEVRNIVESILIEALDRIQKNSNILMYSEIWYLFIFHKCPLIDNAIQDKMDELVKYLCSISDDEASGMTKKLLGEFLRDSTNIFISWELDRIELLADITFRTRHRTIFRNYSKVSSYFDVSV